MKYPSLAKNLPKYTTPYEVPTLLPTAREMQEIVKSRLTPQGR
jgi:hypothetical protein